MKLMRTVRSKIILIIVLISAIICALGIRVYNGHMFFFDMPDRSGWIGEGETRMYLDRHAGPVTDTLLKIGADTYYFDVAGYVYKGEISLGDYDYYFDNKTGIMHTGWLEKEDKRYYYEENGHKVIDREFEIGGNDFLFDAEGAEYTGPIEIGGKQYFFEELTGKLRESEKQLDGLWYYYTEDGSRFGTGWMEMADGRNCYFDGGNGMLFGEQTIEGKPYLLGISMGGRLTGTAYYMGEVYDIGDDGIVNGKERIPLWSGIDVSQHQGPNIDWAAVKESGAQFVVVRAGYIGSEKQPYWVQDEYFVQNVIGAQEQGLSVGAYIYLYNFTEEGLAEGIASYNEAAIAGRVKLDLPVFLDVEDADYFKQGSDALGGFEYRTNLIRFGMDRLREYGYDAGFYTFSKWVGKEFDAELLFREGYPFWLARWYDNNEDLDPVTNAWDDDKQPSLWQFRATGKVDGIIKEVDKNYLYWGRMPK